MRQQRQNTIGLGLAVLGVGAVAAFAARHANRAAPARRRSVRGEIQVTEAATVNATLEDVYAFWRRFENFPRFMRHLEAVETSGRRSHWRAIGPARIRVEWEAELLEDFENERISWRTVQNSDIEHHGSVRFARAPGSRGTEVRVHLHYSPPAGKAAQGLAWLLGADPESQIREDLRRVKQILEAGEVVLSDGPALWRPAQPSDQPERLKAMVGVQP